MFGVLIALWLLWGAWSASSHALDQLMDREWPERAADAFLAAAKEYPELARPPRLAHAQQRDASFRAVSRLGAGRLDRAARRMTGSTASRRSCSERFPGTEILIHVDPEGQTDRETLLPQEITERAT